ACEPRCTACEPRCTACELRCTDSKRRCGAFEPRCTGYEGRCTGYEGRCTGRERARPAAPDAPGVQYSPMPSNRRAMTVRVVALRSPETAPPPTAQEVSDRLRLVRELSERSWTQTGRSLPVQSRQCLTCVIRPLRTAADL